MVEQPTLKKDEFFSWVWDDELPNCFCENYDVSKHQPDDDLPDIHQERKKRADLGY